MNVSTAQPDGARRCALALHALHERDREWVLEQLGEEPALRVRALLAELVELGLPADDAFVRQALGSANDAASIDPAACAVLLGREPLGLVVAFLHGLGQAQRERVLQAMEAPRARRVRHGLEAAHARKIPPRLGAAISDAVHRQASPAPRRRSGVLATLWRRCRGEKA